jgi:hypothetical protein
MVGGVRDRELWAGSASPAAPASRDNSTHTRWTAPENTDEIDRQVVANPKQVCDLLAAAGGVMPELTAFFGCMYYAALRPEEVFRLREDEYERPKRKGE